MSTRSDDEPSVDAAVAGPHRDPGTTTKFVAAAPGDNRLGVAQTCPSCDGRGALRVTSEDTGEICTRCAGTGYA